MIKMRMYNMIKDTARYFVLAGALSFTGCAANIHLTDKDRAAHAVRYEKKRYDTKKDAAALLYRFEPTKQECRSIDIMIRKASDEYELNKVNIFEKYISVVCSDKVKGAKEDFDHKLDVSYKRKMTSLVYSAKSFDEEEHGNTEAAIKSLDTCIILNPFDRNFYIRRGKLRFQIGNDKEAEEDADIATKLSIIKKNEAPDIRDKKEKKMAADLVEV